jgi:hypothetical protein
MRWQSGAFQLADGAQAPHFAELRATPDGCFERLEETLLTGRTSALGDLTRVAEQLNLAIG